MGSGGGGSDGGAGLSTTAAALTVIFAIVLVALLVTFFYVLWRRRVFLRQTNIGGDRGDEDGRYSLSESNSSSAAYSKELLYFLCVRPQFRLDCESVTGNTAANDLNPIQQSDREIIDIELLKIQAKFGPPRFLFTFREEAKEDTESPAGKSLRPAAETKRIDDDSGSTASLEECVTEVDETAAVVEIDDRCAGDATPFSTPCAASPYFTPSASPLHEAVNGRSTDEGMIASMRDDAV